MSSTALRAVRELRGDMPDSRPGTSSGARPSTSGGRNGSATTLNLDDSSASSSVASSAAHQKEVEDLTAALEKERRNSRALESYLSEVTLTKETEISTLQSDLKTAQTSLHKLEAHVTSLEEMHKQQVTKLISTVERLQVTPPSTQKESSDVFATVLRDEMKSMQQAYTLKLEKLQAELNTKSNESARQIRLLNEQLMEEKKNNANLIEKMTARENGLASRPTTAAGSPMKTNGSTSSSSVSSSAPSPKITTTSVGSNVKPTVKPMVKK